MKKQECQLACLKDLYSYNQPCQYTQSNTCGLNACTIVGHFKTCTCSRHAFNAISGELGWGLLSRDVYSSINSEEYPPPMKRQKGLPFVLYKPAQVKCNECGSCVCFDAYNEYSDLTEAHNFEPRRAYLYTERINKQALLLYWIRRHCSPNLPNGILEMILKYII